MLSYMSLQTGNRLALLSSESPVRKSGPINQRSTPGEIRQERGTINEKTTSCIRATGFEQHVRRWTLLCWLRSSGSVCLRSLRLSRSLRPTAAPGVLLCPTGLSGFGVHLGGWLSLLGWFCLRLAPWLLGAASICRRSMVWSTVLRWTVLPRLLAPVIDITCSPRGLPMEGHVWF